jgi:hypothetical protein
MCKKHTTSEGEGKMEQREMLQVLGLQAGATWGEVQLAYRGLVEKSKKVQESGDENARSIAELNLKEYRRVFDALLFMYIRGEWPIPSTLPTNQQKVERIATEDARAQKKRQLAAKGAKVLGFPIDRKIVKTSFVIACILFLPIFALMQGAMSGAEVPSFAPILDTTLSAAKSGENVALSIAGAVVAFVASV